MSKIILMFIVLFTASFNFAQNNYSIEFNYGLISPMTRSNGLQGSGKINYQLNKDIKLYTGFGYGVWGAQKVHFKKRSDQLSTLTAEDNHKLIPFYGGANFLLKGSNFLDLYAIAEIGFSYFSYRRYNYQESVNPQTNEKEYFLSDKPTDNISDYLFGVGIGLSGGHKISKNAELLLQIKLNTNYSFNSKNLFDKNITYTSLIFGFNFLI